MAVSGVANGFEKTVRKKRKGCELLLLTDFIFQSFFFFIEMKMKFNFYFILSSPLSFFLFFHIYIILFCVIIYICFVAI